MPFASFAAHYGGGAGVARRRGVLSPRFSISSASARLKGVSANDRRPFLWHDRVAYPRGGIPRRHCLALARGARAGPPLSGFERPVDLVPPFNPLAARDTLRSSKEPGGPRGAPVAGKRKPRRPDLPSMPWLHAIRFKKRGGTRRGSG